MRYTLLTALLATVCSLSAKPVKVHGYITAISSPKTFEIDDYKITSDDTLRLDIDKGDSAEVAFRPEDLRIGIELEVQGDFNDSTHEVHAASIRMFVNDNLRVKRSAVIEHSATLERSGNTFQGAVHADGETIRVNSQTHFVARDQQTNVLNPGASITYEGFRNPDGSITATRFEVFNEGPGRAGQRLRRDSALKLSPDGTLAIHGVKYKLVPDAEAQSYVQRVGAKLVPAFYSRDLSSGAARQLPFEFYLVANDDFNARAFPNGTVLINSGVFRVLTSEAQFAAVLGHEIAHATQEHSYRELQYQKKGSGPEKAADGSAKGDPLNNGYSQVLENQADRVGLEYMVAAGYDPREAPEVWTQVARTAGHKSGFFWNGPEDATMRRSFLLAALRTNYPDLNLQSYTRDREEFDRLAERFGNTAIAQAPPVAANTGGVMEPLPNRPGFQPTPQPQTESQEKRYGANAVTIFSDPPGADVLLNGTPIGKTPMTLPTGNPGLPFILTIQRAGYRSWTGQLVSVPGRTNLRVELFSAR